MLTTVLPCFDSLRFESVTPADDQIVVTAVATAPTSACPLCRQHSSAVHSRYRRTVADLPLAGVAVVLHIRVRKFFCRVPTCTRRIFTERLAGFAAPHARRSQGLRAALRRVALALGGEGGARLATALAMPTSPDTLLRLIRSCSLTPPENPRIIGLDEWAWRKGVRYNSADRVAQSALEFTVSVPRTPLRERYGSAWKRAAVPRLSEDDGAAFTRRGT